eukprot:NODE_152_length_16986_cov_0.478119.p10 type:complete len:270 gc:universal NODE_152_length_16986_cov_0.478119:6663-7472(+)
MIFLNLCAATIAKDFVEFGLLTKEIEDLKAEIVPIKKIQHNSAIEAAGIYKRLFTKRHNKIPKKIKEDLLSIESGNSVKSDKNYVSKQFASLLVNIFKCVKNQSSFTETDCHIKAFKGFLRVSELLWLVNKPSDIITVEDIHIALAFSVKSNINGLIKIVEKLSGYSKPSAEELKKVKQVPWEKVFSLSSRVNCTTCGNKVLYYSGNSMMNNVDRFLKVLWAYKESHPIQFGMVPTLGVDQIESLVGKIISDKPDTVEATDNTEDEDEL